MRWISIWLLLALLPAFLLLPHRAHAADAVVGNGNPASCTETAFDNAALVTASNGGGVITFNCGQATKTITLTTAKIVNLGNVTIDGGGRIILAAGANERHFFAGSRHFPSAQHHPAPGRLRWSAAARSKHPARRSFWRMSNCSTIGRASLAAPSTVSTAR
jgi:hypothetical protein